MLYDILLTVSTYYAIGTNQSKIIGIISEHDIVVAQANNPGVLLKQIRKAEKRKAKHLQRSSERAQGSDLRLSRAPP